MTIVGRVFGDLTVIELATKDKNNQTIWKCVCMRNSATYSKK